MQHLLSSWYITFGLKPVLGNCLAVESDGGQMFLRPNVGELGAELVKPIDRIVFDGGCVM